MEKCKNCGCRIDKAGKNYADVPAKAYVHIERADPYNSDVYKSICNKHRCENAEPKKHNKVDTNGS